MENPITAILDATEKMEAATSRMLRAIAEFTSVEQGKLLYTVEEAIEAFGFKRGHFRTTTIFPVKGSGGSSPNLYHIDDLKRLANDLRQPDISSLMTSKTRRRSKVA